jgi:hypothetical protein
MLSKAVKAGSCRGKALWQLPEGCKTMDLANAPAWRS